MKSFIVFILCCPLLAQAAEWAHVGGTDFLNVRVDNQSIAEVKGGGRKAWSEYVYDQPQKRYSAGKEYRRTLELNIYDCAERTIGVAQQVFYANNESGDVIDSIVVPTKSVEMRDVVPGSIGESQLNFACGRTIKKK